jgi:L-ribulose-5-phosphate 3-epimerase
MNRRTFLAGAIGAAALRGTPAGALKIGITDWNLDLSGRIEAVEMAKRLGFDGVQVSIGRKIVDGKMPLDDAELIARYRAESVKHGIPIDSSCLDRLHNDCLKDRGSDAPKRVADGIRITAALGTPIMLVPFFGKCELQKQDLDYTGDMLRELASEAEKAGVILGLENTISAEGNVRIMERARSRAVLVYYDVGNSTQWHHDVLREIPWLGRDRICQFHLKDNPHYLGEGSIDFVAVLKAIRGIGFNGYANLETDAPSHAVEADLRRNLAFVRRILRGQAG